MALDKTFSGKLVTKFIKCIIRKMEPSETNETSSILSLEVTQEQKDAIYHYPLTNMAAIGDSCFLLADLKNSSLL
jgi:hypothetical protein